MRKAAAERNLDQSRIRRFNDQLETKPAVFEEGRLEIFLSESGGAGFLVPRSIRQRAGCVWTARHRFLAA